MEFKAKEMRKVLGITKSKYTNYTSRKLIIRTGCEGGRGTIAIFTKDDLLRNYAFVQLAEYGLDQKVASDLAKKAVINSTSCTVECTDSIAITIKFDNLLDELKPKTKLTRRRNIREK